MGRSSSPSARVDRRDRYARFTPDKADSAGLKNSPGVTQQAKGTAGPPPHAVCLWAALLCCLRCETGRAVSVCLGLLRARLSEVTRGGHSEQGQVHGEAREGRRFSSRPTSRPCSDHAALRPRSTAALAAVSPPREGLLARGPCLSQ